MRRINTRGIQQSNKCMLIAAIAYNLKKLMNFTARKVQADVKAMQQSLHNAFFVFISSINHYEPSYNLYIEKKEIDFL